ncbi:ceramidase domain-containing protein [Rhodobacteraceae bacterium DSL-40]|uniref:ceramidase domain-containing protein n=1 Tax=Amaricoccus sp. B4 TaxID=3368557 RepID=UPI000DAB9C7B
MDWFREVNSYCERTGPGYWSEPVNALTNLAFVAAGLWAWRHAGRAGDRGGRLLAAILVAIGIGSWLFHTHAQVWAMMADVLPILVFILVYVFLATVRFFALPAWAGALAVALYFPWSMLIERGLTPLVGTLNGSMSYVPVPTLIFLYAGLLARRRPETARGLALGAALLCLSLLFRSIDQAVCGAVPSGTHFLWHLCNAVLLGWMIRVMVRDREPEALRSA